MKAQRALAPGEKGRKGNSIIEFSLLAPWYIFLFIGSLDMGLYSYALISVQSAARVAALHCSANSTTAGDSATACTLALAQLKDLPHAPSTCVSPISVTATYQHNGGPDGLDATRVTVQYVMPALPGIPNILPGQYTVSRTVQMKLRS
jgi:Flp pilus assembly protein TadG